MKILVTGPCYYPLGGTGYAGMERLTALLAVEWAKVHEVKVVGGRGSALAGVETLAGAEVGSFEGAERAAFREFGWLLDWADVVIDLSHSHYFRRGEAPGASWIWHDPKLMQPPLPRTGVYALSQWQAKRHLEETGQHVEVLDCICADPAVYYYDERVEVGERWFSLGIFDANKGQKEAALIAEKAGIGLDLAGKPVDAEVVAVVKEVERRTHGRVKYLGELFGTKEAFMRHARGMLYWPSYKEGFGEEHSHKLVEALMMGVPCLVRDQGAMMEVFGSPAWISRDKEGLLRDIQRAEWAQTSAGGLSYINRPFSAAKAASRWSVPNVARRIISEVERCKP